MNKHKVGRMDETKQRVVALLQKNRLSEARTLLEKLCAENKRDIEARHMLGMVSGRLGLFKEAEDCFRSVVSAQPNAMAYCGLASALKEQGKLTDAEENLRRALRIQPGFAEAHVLLGQTLAGQNKLTEAEDSYRQALRLKPGLTDASHGLGEIQQYRGQYQEAMSSYQQALAINPNLAETHNKLGYCLYSQGNLADAAEHYQRALRCNPELFDAYTNLGAALALQGLLEEARTTYRKALQLKPGNVAAIVGEAAAYELEQAYQEAYELLRPLVERGVKQVGLGLTFARLCRHVDRCNDATAYIEELLQEKFLTTENRQGLHNALGKIYDSLGSYDKAFSHFRQGNALKPTSYDPAEHGRAIDALINTYGIRLMREGPRSSNATEVPVFIVGMPRSGTSLVEQILASHSAVHGAGELRDIGQIVAGLPDRLGGGVAYPRCIEKLTSSTADALSNDYLDNLKKLAPHARRVTDKMPHNFLHLGLIAILFPKARIIHCVRDPLDTCLSIYFQSFNVTHGYANDLVLLGKHYRQYEKLMDHWRKTLDLSMLEVRYEDLVADQERLSKKLVEFTGLEWEPDCLRFYASRRFVNTASYEQIRQPIYTKSVGRWKNYEQYIGPLRQALER